jgi:hypothetical protein
MAATLEVNKKAVNNSNKNTKLKYSKKTVSQMV